MNANLGKRAGNRLNISGAVFALIATLLLVAAWNTGNNLFYLLFGGVISFILISFFLMIWNLRNVSMTREAPNAVYRGEPFLTGIRIENHKRLMPAIGLGIAQHGKQNSLLGFVPKTPAKGAALLNIPMTLAKRGLHRLPPFDIETGFPFGLMERRRRYNDTTDVLVYPRVRALRTSTVEQLPGPASVARAAVADGDEFFSLREYLPGDELRRIAWRISARMGVWMVREMSRQHSRFVIFALDTRHLTDLPDFDNLFEEAVELTASLAVSLLKRHYHVTVTSPAGAVEGGYGPHQERKILELLARVDPTPESEDFSSFVRALEPQEARLICISPDPRQWGRQTGSGALKMLNLDEIVHA
ncbi:MAG TPA: DUF58 domain-containing protein [Candidatus Hydrogenedentes bacterium]|nr:DUF58 domain-containing protein [Candidatus Hydrogenedentota bacterium]